MKRDLYQELRTLGFTSDQCCQILDWTENLPIILSHQTKDVRLTISQGIISVNKSEVTKKYFEEQFAKQERNGELFREYLKEYPPFDNEKITFKDWLNKRK